MESKGNGFRFAPHVKNHANIAKTITTRAGGRMDDNFIMDAPSLDCDIFTFNKENVAKVMQIGNIKPSNSWDNPQYGRVYDSNGISLSLLTMQGGNRQPKIVEYTQDFRIRKLTPLECWRLMGFTDEDCNKVKAAGISNSQLYKMAGNSICVSVLQAIFRQLKDIL